MLKIVLITETSAANSDLEHVGGVAAEQRLERRGLAPRRARCSSSNAGLSCRVRRIHQPTTTTTALSRNGIRQPQDSSDSSGSAAIGMKIAVARMLPPWVPARVKLVKNARRSAGACSREVELALDCSPDTARPWKPAASAAGPVRRPRSGRRWAGTPIRNVARPIPNRVMNSTVLRPIVSPR